MAYITDSFDDRIVELLKQGGVGLLPTDTIYGLSCLAINQTSVEKIHKLKDRDSHKPFIVLISDIGQLAGLGIEPNEAGHVKNFWPGGISVVFSSSYIPHWLQLKTASLAVRLPDHQGLISLINKTGPLVSTSANIQGKLPAATPKEAQDIFGNKLDFYVDAGKLEGKPSTLAAIKNGKLKVIRQGAVRIN